MFFKLDPKWEITIKSHLLLPMLTQDLLFSIFIFLLNSIFIKIAELDLRTLQVTFLRLYVKFNINYMSTQIFVLINI